MSIFPDLIVSLQYSIVQMLNAGICIQADLQFISNTAHIHVDHRWSFVYKFAS